MSKMERGIGWQGEVFECAMCGEKHVRFSRHKVYCDACHAERNRELAREKYKRKKREKETSVRIQPRFSLAEWEEAARAHGMSYGKFSAAVKAGWVKPPEQVKVKNPRKKRTGVYRSG